MRHFSIGKINRSGVLMLDRGGPYKEQYCPFTEDCLCGDRCPHFYIEFNKENKSKIFLCLGTEIELDEFVDESHG